MMLALCNISPISELHRSRVQLRKWLLWWQHKSLKLEMSCGDSRRRLLKMSLVAVTTPIDAIGLVEHGVEIVTAHGILLTCVLVLFFFSLVHVCVCVCVCV